MCFFFLIQTRVAVATASSKSRQRWPSCSLSADSESKRSIGYLVIFYGFIFEIVSFSF